MQTKHIKIFVHNINNLSCMTDISPDISRFFTIYHQNNECYVNECDVNECDSLSVMSMSVMSTSVMSMSMMSMSVMSMSVMSINSFPLSRQARCQ